MSKQGTGCSLEKRSVQIRFLICFNSLQLTSGVHSTPRCSNTTMENLFQFPSINIWGSFHTKMFMLKHNSGKQMNICYSVLCLFIALLNYVLNWCALIYGGLKGRLARNNKIINIRLFLENGIFDPLWDENYSCLW